MKLLNMVEPMVFEAISEIKKRREFCDCELCRLDIAALALNKLPPRYVVSDKGEAYGRADYMELQKDLDLLAVVLQAIKKVENSPRHHRNG